VSAPRCGSTAFYRALNLLPGIRIDYEPAFDDIAFDETGVTSRVQELLTGYCGFKHVFDPTGFPFRPDHQATISEMEQHRSLWIRLNAIILNYPRLRVIFLRRRNGFQRIVSDLVGRATNLWGHTGCSISATEAANYKDAVSQVPLPPLDEDLVMWYLEHLPRIEEELRNSITTNAVLDLWYEDLFGPTIGTASRIVRFQQVLQFLQIEAPEGQLQSPELSYILQPSAKLNDESIFSRITNYRELSNKAAVLYRIAAKTGLC
jgi:hypothetical protein